MLGLRDEAEWERRGVALRGLHEGSKLPRTYLCVLAVIMSQFPKCYHWG